MRWLWGVGKRPPESSGFHPLRKPLVWIGISITLEEVGVKLKKLLRIDNSK